MYFVINKMVGDNIIGTCGDGVIGTPSDVFEVETDEIPYVGTGDFTINMDTITHEIGVSKPASANIKRNVILFMLRQLDKIISRDSEDRRTEYESMCSQLNVTPAPLVEKITDAIAQKEILRAQYRNL